MKILACVDCGASIVADRLRCEACHEDAAWEAALPVGSAGLSVMARWIVMIEVLALAVLGLILAVRGCTA